MARKNRCAPPGVPTHVVNRGNDRRIIFSHHVDYVAFIELLERKVRTFPLRIYGYCLMPNHFHLLLEPTDEGALSAFMEDVEGRYACDFRRQTKTVGHGHVVQRRFFNALIRDDNHFLAVLRYIEANPVRAKQVSEAQYWPFSSFCDRQNQLRRILSPLPVLLPTNWADLVNATQRAEVVEKIRREVVPRVGRPSKEAGDATPFDDSFPA